jgi:hypothetical protein
MKIPSLADGHIESVLAENIMILKFSFLGILTFIRGKRPLTGISLHQNIQQMLAQYNDPRTIQSVSNTLKEHI